MPTPALKARNAPGRLYRGLATASKKPRDERQPSAPGNEERGLPWYKQSGTFQCRAAVNHQLRCPFALGDGDFPLPKPVRSAILVSKRPRIWRMSVETETDTVVWGMLCALVRQQK